MLSWLWRKFPKLMLKFKLDEPAIVSLGNSREWHHPGRCGVAGHVGIYHDMWRLCMIEHVSIGRYVIHIWTELNVPEECFVYSIRERPCPSGAAVGIGCSTRYGSSDSGRACSSVSCEVTKFATIRASVSDMIMVGGVCADWWRKTNARSYALMLGGN